MLFDDDSASESDDSQSEFTSSDDDHLSDVENSENDDGSDSSEATVDYQTSSAFVWSSSDPSVRTLIPFTGISGRRFPVSDSANPLSTCFLLTAQWTPQLRKPKTNRRAQQLIQSKQPTRRSRLNHWTDTTCDELKVLFAVLIYQGIVQKPEVELYWSTKPLLETPYIRKLMTAQCFSLLMKCLHFVDNSSLAACNSAAEKSFWKIMSFYDALTDRFSIVYLPEEHISIDESLMLWKGRLAMKQYTASERARFGLKSYELCESQSGYLWKSIVHTGPAMQQVDSPDRLR